MDPILEVKGLNKRFGGLQAVSNVSVSIPRGQKIGIIGPNGAGKTTFFNLLTGFIRPDKGEVLLAGESLIGKKPHEIVTKGMARTFQIVRPFHQLKVLDNVIVPYLAKRMLKRGTSRGFNEEQAAKILEDVGLGEKINFLAADLSHGDLRRLEVARALATGPSILLLDEPFSGLALKEIGTLFSLIQKLNEEGLTIIIIEHKLRELMKLVERVIVLSSGAQIADCRPEEISSNEVVIKAYLGKGGGKFGNP